MLYGVVMSSRVGIGAEGLAVRRATLFVFYLRAVCLEPLSPVS